MPCRSFETLLLSCLLLCSTSAILADEYAVDDLPAEGETLNVTENSILLIGSDETGVWGGEIVVNSGVHLDFFLDGNLEVDGQGSLPSLVVEDESSVSISGPGSLTGQGLSLDNRGGSLDWIADGDVLPENLQVLNQGLTEVRLRSHLSVKNLALNNQWGDSTLNFETEGAFEADNLQISNSGHQARVSLLRSGMSINNLAIQHDGSGTTELSSAGVSSVNNGNLRASGTGTVILSSSGMWWTNNLNTQCYGALFQIQNVGSMGINNWYIKDQNDDSEILVMGTLEVNNLSIVANGAKGAVNWTSQGLVRFENVNLDANYGGAITVDASAGGLAVTNLHCDASGWSHGVESTILVRAGRDLRIDQLAIPSVEPGPIHLESGEVFEVSGQGKVRLEAMAANTIGAGWGAPLVYPQLALGGGYEAVLIVTNMTSAQWSGTARLRQGLDLDWEHPWTVNGTSGDGPQFAITLPPNGSKRFLLRGDDTVRNGYLCITAADGSNTRGVTTSFFYNFTGAQGLLDSTGAPASLGGVSFAFPVEKGPRLNTGFAWIDVTPEDSDFNIVVSLYDADGEVTDSTIMSYGGHLARFFAGPDGLFPSVPDGFVGKMIVRSDRVIHLTVLRLEYTSTGFQLTSIPPETSAP